jgi:hypothetical protein
MDLVFKAEQRSNPQNFVYKVIRCFDTHTEASEFEMKLHRMFQVHKHPSFYNLANSSSLGFGVSGSVAARDSITGKKLGYVALDDPRWSTNEIIGPNSAYAFISNGTEERVYRVDGTDSIPEGWSITQWNKPLYDVFDVETGDLIAQCVALTPWSKKNNTNLSNGQPRNKKYHAKPTTVPLPAKREKIETKGTIPVRNWETGECTTRVPRSHPAVLNGTLVHSAEPYARITNGTEERVYRLDGTDVIPDGWWVCYQNRELVDVFSYKTGELVASCVSARRFAAVNGLVGNNLAATLHSDHSVPSTKTNPHHHKGLYIRVAHC